MKAKKYIMQNSQHASNNTFLGGLSLSIPLVVWMFERLFVQYQFSSEFKIVVFLLTCTSIGLGVFALWNSKEIKSAFAIKATSLIGVFLSAGLLYFALIAKPPEMTGTILDIYSYAENESYFGYKRSLTLSVDLPANELVESNLDPQEPIFIVNSTGDTAIYEQTGKARKKTTDEHRLQKGQHIRVEWNGFIWITDPAQVDARNITILEQ